MIYLSELPTAKQAKEMVNSRVDNKANEELEHVTKLILSAINNNKTYVTGNGTLMQMTIEKLRKLGYKVDNGSQYNESFYSVKW